MDHTQQNKPWYSEYYESAWRWIEDTYLKHFGENRTSYGVKGTLQKTEITGNKDVDGVQRSVGEVAGNTLKPDNVGGVVGDIIDKGILKGNI